MDHFDVAVIGAGPIGSMAAKYAAKADAQTILLEEHASIGWPVQCAGLLGRRAIAESELVGRFLTSCEAFLVPRSIPQADESWTSRPTTAGPKLWTGGSLTDLWPWILCGRAHSLRLRSSVRKMRKEEGSCILTLAGGEEIQTKIVISAEGVRARLARQAGIASPQVILSGAQVEVPFAVNDPEKVEVHLGQAPGLFAWVIPTSEKTARIGLCARERGYDYLQAFLKTDVIKKRILGSAVVMNVGGLPLGPPAATAVDGLLAVGDAAGQVKPTSGGGIYPGLVAAKIAGGVAAAAALEGDSSAERLGEYDRLWRAALGRELEIGMRVNRMLNKMSNAEIDELVGYLASKPRLIKTIEEHGDIDRPSLLMAKMLRHLDWDAIRLARLLGYALG